MGVHILQNKEDDHCCFYCSTTEWAFGPVMRSYEEAEEFENWLKPTDPRKLKDSELESKNDDFRKERLIVCSCGGGAVSRTRVRYQANQWL